MVLGDRYDPYTHHRNIFSEPIDARALHWLTEIGPSLPSTSRDPSPVIPYWQ